MKRRAGIFAVLAGVAAMSVATSAVARQQISLNANWSFSLAPETSAERVEPAWQTVTLPHTWNADDGRNKTQPYHRGTGYYRKSLYVSRDFAGKKLYLYFEGANQTADVSINGGFAGRHVGGYSAFAVDISKRVRFGEDNEIEVRVDNTHDGDVPPLNADFTFYGGLYRDVWLLVLEDVHFSLDEFAATDVRVRLSSITEQRARVVVDAVLANTTSEARDVDVDVVLADSDAAVVARASVSVTLTAGSETRTSLPAMAIDVPRLWSPESPHLYRVIATLRQGDRELDRVSFPLGLRWFEADARSGFHLNGKPYRLFGTNRHQDVAGLGNAVPDALHRGDLQKIKDDGFNFLRLAHYPQDPAVLKAADELGLIVWEEIPIVNLISTSSAFRDHSARMLREMVRQHRHHPSVVFWGYMNEVMLRKPDPLPEGYYDEVLSLARQLEGIAKEEDPDRLTATAQSYDEVDNGVPLAAVPDILALNLYFGWYYGEFETLGDYLDDLHRKHPERPLMISEYGAGSDERVHARYSQRFDFSTEYQQRFHEATFRQILDRPWLVGSAVWNQFDFGSNHRQDTKFGINQKGLWRYDRAPKDIAWYYRAQLRSAPVLYIAARDWKRRAGSRSWDAVMTLRVYGNVESAELLLDGRSLGTRRLDNASAAWEVRFAAGANTLTARAAGLEDRVTIHYEDRSGLFDGSRPATLAVNAGGAEQYIDAAGLVWEADRHYRQGNWGFIGGSSERSHHRIFDSEDDPLYQTRRRGAHQYRFDVPDGAYLARLHFAKLDEDTKPAEARVDVNGVSLPLPARAPYTRSVFEALVVATNGNGIRLQYPDSSSSSFVNGIVIEPRQGVENR